jgi:hypothetical protein
MGEAGQVASSRLGGEDLVAVGGEVGAEWIIRGVEGGLNLVGGGGGRMGPEGGEGPLKLLACRAPVTVLSVNRQQEV